MQTNPVVILTREEKDNNILCSALDRLKIPNISYPCIKTVLNPIDRELHISDNKTLNDFNIIVFSSRKGIWGIQNAYEYLSNSSHKLAAIGKSTALEIEENLKRKPEFIADPSTSENLAKLLSGCIKKSDRILYFRGNKSSGIFKKIMNAGGFKVTEKVVYRNNTPEIAPINTINNALLVFASPSAVKNFFSVNKLDKISSWTSLAIGPTTFEYLKKIGKTKIEQTGNPDSDSLLNKIVELTGYKNINEQF